MLDSENKADKYFDFYLKIFYNSTLWPPNDSKWKISVSSFFLIPSYLFFFILSLMEIAHNWGEIDEMTETLDMTLIYTVTSHKCVTLLFYHKEFKKLVDILENNFYVPDQRVNSEKSAIIKKTIREAKWLTIIWTILCAGAVLSFTVLPLFDGIIHYLSSGNVSYTWRLPFRNWSPFDTAPTWTFVIMFVFHFFMGVLQFAVVSSFDNFFISLLNHTCSQFKILQLSLERLKENALLNINQKISPPTDINKLISRLTHPELSWHKLDRNENLNGKPFYETEITKDDETVDNEMHSLLINSVRHHKSLIKFVSDLDSLVNPIMLSQFISSSVIICTTAFQIAVNPAQGGKLLSMLSLLIAALYELGMFCYFANLVQDEGVMVGKSAYNSEWFGNSEKLKRALRIIMARSDRPVKMTFGKFSSLTLENYSSILQISYTYFTMLTRLNET